jgi:hypothetical protein
VRHPERSAERRGGGLGYPAGGCRWHSEAIAQAIIGHDSAASSALYTHLSAEDLRPAVDLAGRTLLSMLSPTA